MPDKEKAKEELRKLIEKYHKQKSEIANEEQVCQSLILPLFSKVLGWDTEDPSEFKSQYSQRGKRSDYVAFLNGISQFVIEAKALDREIKQNYQDYEQAINYAKNKEKDFAILTNFKHFIVLRADTEALPLQCEVRAIDIEKAAEKEEDFNIIWNFQKEAWSAEKGDALYRLKPGKKVEPVSKRLVEDMRKWRSALLNNIRKHGRLNDFADFDKERPYIEQEIQRFIDRLIFICYCEDKELKEKELKGLLELKESKHFGKESFLVNEVKELFKDYRVHYDSDLFFEQGYCDRFRFEDSVLTEIIRDLRKPSKKLPYNFADIEADVLGKAYENFIGHIITGEKRFGEKESRSKRKEEGVYYTPQYIVNYIVDNTLRAYIRENSISSFENLLKIKVLDPACGSGTFLIRAFEVLEEEARSILGRALNYDEKVKMMTGCVFGVDKDERAVDITKLRLSLALAARQKLPELGNNIKCGDSLIDDEAIAQEKAFKWEERFKDIMQNGGFDVVVGNPPYGAELNDNEKNYLDTQIIKDKSQDTANYFIAKGISILKNNGVLGYIVPKGLTYVPSSKTIRKSIIKNQVRKLLDVSEAFGVDVQLEQIILILEKNFERNYEFVTGFFANNKFDERVSTSESLNEERLLIWADKKSFNIINKILRNSLKLQEFADSRRGLGCNKHVTDNKNDFVCLKGANVQRYYLDGLNYVSKSKIDQDYKWLLKPKIIAQEIVGRYGKPLFGNFRNIRLKAVLDLDNSLTLDTVVNIFNINNSYDMRFILGLLNSKLMSWFFHIYFYNKAQITVHFGNEYVRNVPVPKKVDEKNQKKISGLADKMLSLNARLNEIGDKHTVERERIGDDIKKTDAEIDELVYQLYGITEEEKKIIKESLA